MRVYVKLCFSALLIACFSLAIVSCKQTSKTTFIPLSGGSSGGPGDGDVSATAVIVNGATEAYNDYSYYYTAYNNTGYGMALWNSNTGYISHVVYSIYDPSTGVWSEPREFAKNTNYFRVASNGTGFMVVYDSNSRIYARQWTNGAFGAVTRISDNNHYSNSSIIASNGSGYCAVWQQYDTDRYNMYAAMYNGTSWSDPAQLDSTVDSPGNYSIATNGTGYCVTWHEYSSPQRLFASIYAGSSWTAAAAVDNGSYPSNYSVAGNASRYIIVFNDSSNDVYANVYNAGWGGASLISGGDIAQMPSIASNGTTLCCVWHENVGSKYSIYASMYDNSLGWSTAETIDNGTYEALYPKVASDGSGYCAVWQQSDGASTKIYARRYTTSWQDAELMNPLSTEGSSYPYIYANSTGYLAHWIEYVSGDGRIGSSVYNGTAWSSMALIDAEYHSISNMYAYPFTGGYGFSYSYYMAEGNGLMANVYRSDAWAGAVDVAAGKLNGSCYSYNPPILYRVGSETIAVWLQWDKANGGASKLYASVKTGTTWGAPLLIGGYIGDYYAVSNGTDLCVVWTTYDNTKSRNKLMGMIYSGGAWGSETLLDNDVNNLSSSYPRVAGNASSSDFCVAWVQYDGSSVSNLYVNFHTASGWGVPSAKIDTGTGSVDNSYILAGDTNYCVAYNQDSRTYGVVYDGAWSAPAELDPGYQFTINRNTMAASGDQFAITNYRSSDVYVNVHDGSSWSGMIVQDSSPSNGAYNPVVTGDGSGGFCLAWYEYISNADIVARIYDGSDWGEAASLNYVDDLLNSNSAYTPRLASNGSGYAVAFIQYNEYSTNDLFANVYDSGSGSWIGAERLDESIVNVENDDYAISSNGTGYGVAWQQWNTSGVQMVYGSAFSGSAWTGATLSNGEGNVDVPQVIGSGSSYTAAWFQINADDSAVKDLWSDVFD